MVNRPIKTRFLIFHFRLHNRTTSETKKKSENSNEKKLPKKGSEDVDADQISQLLHILDLTKPKMSRFLFANAAKLLGLSSGQKIGITKAGFRDISSSTLRLSVQSQNTKFGAKPIIILNHSRFNSTSSAATATAANTSTVSEITDKLPSITDIASETAKVVADVHCDHVGYLSKIGLVDSWWWPADFLARTLEATYVYTGLPWWATIAIVTVGMRLTMFPLYVKSSDVTARLSHVREELDDLNQKTRELSADPQMIQKVAAKRRRLFQKNGIKLRYTVTPFVQIPFALGMFGALRKMANYPVEGMPTGGFAWFTDLSAADPYLGLQVLTAAAFMGFMRIGGETGTQQFSPIMKKVFTFLPLISIPLTMNLSAAIIWYFAINAVFSICQTTVLKNKTFRKKFNMAEIAPPKFNPDGTPKTSSFSSMWENAKRQAETKKTVDEVQQETLKKMQEISKMNGLALKKSAFKKTIYNDRK